MHYGLTVTVAPSAEPVSLAEAKEWLVLGDIPGRDAVVLGLIRAARERAELETQRALVTQTLRLTMDRFPNCEDCESWLQGETILLPRPPLLSVLSIAYVDTDGVTQILDSSLYDVDAGSEPGRLAPAWSEVWPTTRTKLAAVTITYIAGYGAASAVPEGIKLAMRLMLAHWYLHPEEVAADNLAPIPLGAKAILDGFWSGGYA